MPLLDLQTLRFTRTRFQIFMIAWRKFKKSSNHLLSLLNDVLDFTRIESGKVTISPEPMDIAQLTDNVQAIMNGLLYNRDLKFEVHREISKNPYVLADVVRIREVFGESSWQCCEIHKGRRKDYFGYQQLPRSG